MLLAFTIEDDFHEESVNELAGLAFAAGPGLLPVAPQRDVTEIERVPPGIEHGGIETEDALSGDSSWGRHERGEAVVYAGTLCVVDSC